MGTYQGLTITIISPYVITYVCQNFVVRNVREQIPKYIYMKRHTSYLAVLLTIFPELVFIQIELKIANSAKAKIEISFKKISIP